jgi:hypothetical protein
VIAVEERWAPVRGYEGRYEISDRGRVRGLRYGRLLRPARNSSGYPQVSLHGGDGSQRGIPVHRLVAIAFVEGEAPGLEVCHGDGDKLNPRAENLRWDTRSANMHDRVRHGTHQMTRRTHCIHGHPFADENTYRTIDGRRICKTCRTENKRAYRARKAGQS